jgi:hypothetical protein
MRRSSMQFGKFHGWAVVIFGFLLILAQVGLFLIPRPVGVRPGERPASPAHVSYVPAGLGIVSIGTGLTLLVKNWNRKQE